MIYVIVFILFWLAVPIGVLLAFTTFYGYHAECETTWHLGPGAKIGIEFNEKRLYWCPVGLIGFEVEML